MARRRSSACVALISIRFMMRCPYVFTIVLLVHDGPNDARTTSRETKELPLGPGCWGRRASADDRIECQLDVRRGGGAWMGASPRGCRFAIFFIAVGAVVARTSGDSMPVLAGISQRR